jgi:bacterial leucyl aminopeptidase
MFAKKLLPLCVAGALVGALMSNVACAAEPAAQGNKVWITIGDQGYTQLQKMLPGTRAAQSSVRSNGNKRVGLATQEKIHLVQIDESQLMNLSARLHSELHRCGGFAFHSNKADGQLALAGAPVTTLAAIRPNYVLDNQTAVNAMLPNMQASNISQTITDLSTGFVNRYYTTTAGANASTWLMNKWKTMANGRSDITVEQYTHSWKQKSVILTIRGTDFPDEVVVMGGHLDSINKYGNGETSKAPGADDDASGIASLTEAYRAMLVANYKPRRTIKIMGYAAEEAGLKGSADIAAKFKATNVNVAGVLQLDMTNYKGAANDIYIFTDYTDSLQNGFIEKLIRTYQPSLTIGYDVCGYGCSDHASWSKNGYYASMPFESSFALDNKKIHTPDDTLANSDITAVHALKFAKLALSFAVELGSDAGAVVVPPRTETFTGTLATGATKLFGPFKVGVGSMKLSTTGTGDMDIYGRKTSAPTTSTYDCKSAGSTSTETCTVTFTANGDGYVLVKAYTAGNYNLTVTYTPQ